MALSERAAAKPFIGAVEDEWQLYSNNSADYTLGLPIGFGSSSIVYTALYNPPALYPDAQRPPPIPCALKVIDLDSLPPHSLRLLKRETALMSLSKHPNVLRVRGTWMDGHKLYIALRLMSKGSAADVMRYAWPGGMDEEVVRCILKQALEGLNYLHINGFIHRDVKAANMLIDDDGTVLLGDLGVAANLADDNDHHHPVKRVVSFDPVPHTRPKVGKRKSFVGTPCWMAPELIQGHQYDASADIWSFGITALELTQGRPPRSRDPPQKVLLKIVQDEPPTLERQAGQHKYSRAFKEIVASCLNKDPAQRPTAAQLLATPFFKTTKKKSFLVGTGGILTGLPPLTQRQERRAKPGFGTGIAVPTVDSWDFMTTLRSPLTSIVGHGRGTSGSHGHGHRSRSGSGNSYQTSPTTSVFGRSRATSLSGQSPTSVTRRGQLSDKEEDTDSEDGLMYQSKAVHLGDGNNVDVTPKDGRGGSMKTSSTSSLPVSSDGCGKSSPPSSVSGSAPTPSVQSPPTRPVPVTTAKPTPALKQSTSSSSFGIWRKLTRGTNVRPD